MWISWLCLVQPQGHAGGRGDEIPDEESIGSVWNTSLLQRLLPAGEMQVV